MDLFNLIVDLEKTVKKYPGLNIVSDQGKPFLDGELELIDEQSGLPYAKFSVTINYPESFPYRFPIVYEIGGFIPRTPERHVYRNGNLCLDVPPHEFILCRYGITTNWFIENILIPRLADEIVVSRGRNYTKEYSHNKEGLFQFYLNALKTDDRSVVIRFVELLAAQNLPKGFEDCPCGSHQKFKKCHRKLIFELQSLSPTFFKEQLINLTNE